MRRMILSCGLVLVTAILAHAQEPKVSDKLNWLIGEWKGEGTGEPGQGEGVFTFESSLDGKVVIRKSHSEYPAAKDKPLIVHDDLMTLFSEDGLKAIYFDNEGHIIHYSVNASSREVVMTSDKQPDMPVFRLTYTLLDDGVINVSFDMSQDGEKFMTYVQGKSKRIK